MHAVKGKDTQLFQEFLKSKKEDTGREVIGSVSNQGTVKALKNRPVSRPWDHRRRSCEMSWGKRLRRDRK